MSSPRSLPPLSLYIHIPWCVRKCPYCDFNSHQAPDTLPETDYVTALLDDLAHDSQWIQGRPLYSIFIGGGTPSLFSAQAMERLMQGIDARWPIGADTEVTLEANPGTFEQARFADYRRLGINRLSIGIQSFANAQLKALGRVHDQDEARRAVTIARQAGFDNVNLDLMFGLPGQHLDAALNDLRVALAFEPSHLSWYQLTLEPNTEFYRYPPALPADELLMDMHEAGLALLADKGFERYEISAFARDQRYSRHNLNYWLFGDYLGIGAGAHGKVSLPEGEIVRTRKTRQPTHYLNRQTLRAVEQQPVPASELSLEFMMNALRLNQGSDKATYEARTGLPFDALQSTLNTLAARGLLVVDGDRFQPSQRGFQLLNELLVAFMPDS